MIAQGSSELNISFVVRQEDGPTAVRAIHREFNLSKEG
jgi:aspartate kinase